MTRIDRLIGEASKRTCEAIVMSSLRQVHLFNQGGLRPFSNRALATKEIIDMLLEIAPGKVRSALAGDCELQFVHGDPPVEIKLDRKADFIFVRIELTKARKPQAPHQTAATVATTAAKAAAPSPKPAAPTPAPAPAPKSATPVQLPKPPPGASFFDDTDLDLGTFVGKLPIPVPAPPKAAAKPAAPAPAAPAKPAAPAPPAGPFGSPTPPPVSPSTALELDFSGVNPDTAAPARSAMPDFGSERDFEMAGADDAPLELDTGDHGIVAGVQSFSASAAAPAPAAEPPPLVPEETPTIPARMVSAVQVPEPEPGRAVSSPMGGVLGKLLKALVSYGGSDLHLATGSPPRMRVRGELVCVGEITLSPADTQGMFETVLDAEQRKRWEKELALDFSMDVPGIGRFRANAYRQRKGLDLVFRAIAGRIPTLAELGLPPAVEKLTTFPNGLILVTGPAGCGKSTTQAAIIDRINETWHDHIITVEDPIEFIHPPKGCLINQREVGTHVRTFAEALRSALREDPDVILVGELRDLETIQLAITAAETGHLVLGTLHTIDSARTIDRLIDVFPGEQKLQMRSMVSESLRGVISQRLVPAAEGNGRVAAFEVLVADRSVANLIREGKTFQIPNVLKTGRAKGMCSMDDSLIELVAGKKITPQAALEHMARPEDLEKALPNLRRAAARPPGQAPGARPAAAAGPVRPPTSPGVARPPTSPGARPPTSPGARPASPPGTRPPSTPGKRS